MMLYYQSLITGPHISKQEYKMSRGDNHGNRNDARVTEMNH